MNRTLRAVVYAAIVVLAVFNAFLLYQYYKSKPEPADLVLLNGRIVTLDPDLPEARALAARDGRIIQVGGDKEIKRLAGKGTTVIDLKGAFTIPGLIESHGHFTSLGASKMILDLTSARSWDEIVAMVASAVSKAAPGEWIRGRGWHQDKWDRVPEPNVNGLPVHDALSRVSPENPVVLTHASGHSSLANARAMELSGITAATLNPPGGEIVRDDKGRPIGAFIETAQGLLRQRGEYRTPQDREELIRKQVLLAAEECLRNGVTTFHDAGTSYEVIDVYKRMAEEGGLPVRVYAMLSVSNAQLQNRGGAYRLINYADAHLTVRTVKRLIDGALGSHGAWLLEPYSDLPTSTGLNTEPLDSLRVTAAFAFQNGFQLAVHAIGDRAVRETLNIYEEAFRTDPRKIDLRWRVEHAQHIDPADLPRFKQLNVIAAMQGIHCTSDGPWVFKRLGPERAEKGAYVWRKLLDQGVVISSGTDVPVEAVDPMANFHALVTRKMKDGTAFFPEQRMTREEALRSYTINGAFAAFEEGIKGSLTPGKLADVTCLSRDLLTCPEDEIPSTEVLYTIVGGKVLYRKR